MNLILLVFEGYLRLCNFLEGSKQANAQSPLLMLVYQARFGLAMSA